MADIPNPADGFTYADLKPGDAAPWFEQRTPHNPEFRFDTMGGRYVLLCFFGSSVSPIAQRAAALIQKRRACFDDVHLSFFGVTLDPKDENERKLRNVIPGIRFFYDFDGRVSRAYGALPRHAGDAGQKQELRPRWILLDRMLRVVANIPCRDEKQDSDALLHLLDHLPPFAGTPEFDSPPPVLMLPNIFEPALCQHLIGLYQADGGYESGFMNAQGGKTVGAHNPVHKRRRDYFITDPALIDDIQRIFRRRLVPEIAKAYQFHATYIERFLVACYDAKDEGHFNAHRDHTTPGTAHRQFAVTLNLNDAFEGGELSFPEFGARSFKPPAGGAVVFSCAMLHAAAVVTKGTRYAFLPFLYNDAAEKIRAANSATIVNAALEK